MAVWWTVTIVVFLIGIMLGCLITSLFMTWFINYLREWKRKRDKGEA